MISCLRNKFFIAIEAGPTYAGGAVGGQGLAGIIVEVYIITFKTLSYLYFSVLRALL